MASFAPTARAAAAPAAPRTRTPAAEPARRSRRASKAVEQRRVAGGALWIGLVALLLAGIVAVNVASLQLNLRLDDLTRQRTKLRSDNAALASKLASAAASMRIQRLAQSDLGLVPAREGETTYVNLNPAG